jgi:2-keto-4-pentenoate hydratase/2-oxohepta-3-ene-1,7-dioic acid hydratase in catechol pathway
MNMKIVRYQVANQAFYGALGNDHSIMELVGSPFNNPQIGSAVTDLDSAKLLAPVNPQKIICVGLNYVSHINEMGLEQPQFPMLFMKPHTTITHPGNPIVYPTAAVEVEYEAELTAVIGKTARRVSENEALDYVLGYTCGNDVTQRAIQRAEMANGAMLISKGFDSFCPLGPVIDTSVDPSNLALSTRVNGITKQTGNTSDLLFNVAKLVSYASDAMTLVPGDVILTGTPSGVGPIISGDIVEVEIENIGILNNPVISEENL